MSWQDSQSVSSDLLKSPFSSAEPTFVLNPTQGSSPLQLPTFFGTHSSYPKTIAFIDSKVSDVSALLTNVQSDIKVVLDPSRDGITQITETLKHYQGLTGVEIISHGNVAELQLGNALLGEKSLEEYAPELHQWTISLAQGADILLYGCNVASGEVGQSFVNRLSMFTGADVAASTDLTGSPLEGGNWGLEYATGSIETANPLTDSLMNSYQGLLATLFTTQTPSVTNTTDGTGSAGDYELGMEFRSAKAGTINAIRYYKAPSETGTHIGKIWSSTGQLLTSVTFTNETASGWQEQALSTPLAIDANTTYVVSTNANSYYVVTAGGLATTLTNGDLSAVADGSNGVFNTTPGNFPTQSYNNGNYFRDVVFTSSSGNTPGTLAISGTTTQGNTLTAAVSDVDGLAGSTITYQWQQTSDGGTTWTPITGATTPTLTLDNSYVGKQLRVNAIYTDTLGTNENIFSNPTSIISAIGQTQSIFTTQTPSVTNTTDGTGSAGDYELGMEFRSAKAGTINAIRYYKAPSETGTHIGKIWSSTGQLLTSVTFTNETASGWQEQALSTPLAIDANTTYVVSTNANSYYVVTAGGLATTLTNGDLSAVADGSNGVFNTTPGNFPTQSYNNGNYFRDVVFTSSSGNTPGTLAISGTTTQGNTLTAAVSDVDGLAGSTITYQWQQTSDGGTTWTPITGATTPTLTLDNSYVGKQLRVNAIYTDTLGTNENIFSNPTSIISAIGQTQSIFTTQTPSVTNTTDGTGSAGDYELGMEFRSAKAGTINAIRYYKAPSETGTHIGKIWSNTGQLLTSVTFTNETSSGWQEQALSTPLAIDANTTYVVSTNANSYYVVTAGGLATTLTNGDLSAVADGSNGVFNTTPGSFPTQSYNNGNYFRDVVFTPATAPPANNTPGTIAVSGAATQNQVLTATVSDADGLTGVPINYQWQQSSDNGSTWTNITGATGQTLTLAQAQVNQLVRAKATYIDAQGSSETVISAVTSKVLNVNDQGIVALSGTTAQGSSLTATVADADGLSGATISYQWQKSSDSGSTWSNIAGATNRFFNLDSSLVGNRVRVLATYTDALGSSENILSTATIPIAALLESLFSSTATPSRTNLADGTSYELGMQFTSTKAGQIQAIRYWKASSETGTHIGKIWSNTGQLLASVTFTNETASGWQKQLLDTPVTIAPNTTYYVSVNANTYYASTSSGFATPITNGDIVGVNGLFGASGSLPTQSYQNSNYYRDIVFAILTPPAANNPGTISIGGTATEDQTLTATVADADGLLPELPINYQWQQLVNGTWTSIAGETKKTLILDDAQVGQQVRVKATYIDAQGSSETVISAATAPIVNINDPGVAILKGSATVGRTLTANILDNDGLAGVTINYQWQQLVNGSWTNIASAIDKTLALDTTLLGKQVRTTATYTDAQNTVENVFSLGAEIATFNPIVLENQKTGTTAWKITNPALNNEIAGFSGATSVNKGEFLSLKVSLAQAGQYKIDVYRLGDYGGTGGRLVTSSGLLNGVTQSGPTIDPTTRLVEYNWNTSYSLYAGTDWTSGLYIAKLTDIRTGKESQIWFAVRDDNRPADIGFQASFTTYEAYNNYGGYSLYGFNSLGGQRAYAVSFDRPFGEGNNIEAFNNMLTWEYNMVRWVESQGYDVSYYTNLDVHTNPLQLYSQNTFLSAGHDEYWSMEMFDNVEKARDNGTNLTFFSANTAYWRVRFEPSSTGQANRVMVSYKQDWALDPVAQNDVSQATTTFRSPELNRPENSLLGVMYTGDIGSSNVYQGFDFVVTNASDPYYAHTGLQNGDKLTGLVGYEWDAVVNNGLTPSGLVVLSQSTVYPTGGLPALPAGTNINISNAVRYTTLSGAKVFSTGSIQWLWGLDSDGVTNPREDTRAQQIAVNVFEDMGAIPQTPDPFIVV
jgi:hypothetical protein